MIPFDLSRIPAFQNVASEVPRRTDVIDSAALLTNGKLIHIEHRGQLYSLRETRLGKLILTK